ncbi:MAG: hypothetical protein AMR96_00200 [Candidatus Adiutrix intracellularis]|jgi:uncharacterized protein (TIGR00251 family)|nr:MAG: hypothetical protein AMR96_00200 [Candidatus Adiutrix intracellularis]MDR2827434.1 DUF167 domain-containing protein [Candidatus Adiutrix intracellularis]
MTSNQRECYLRLLISPRAKTDAIVGFSGTDLKLKIAAPPVGGAANIALVKFLADLLEVKPASLNFMAGQRGRRKIVKIEGLTEEELRVRLNNRLFNPLGGNNDIFNSGQS